MKQLRTLVVTGLAALAAAGLVTIARSQNPGSAAVASFNADGSLNLPTGYRHWVHIGTRLKPIGINILDGLPTKTPEIFNAYVEPHAFTLFRKTGRWLDGTQIVREFSAVRVGQGCDPATFLCSSPIGAGIFESDFVGLGMMVKDDKRFSDFPGHLLLLLWVCGQRVCVVQAKRHIHSPRRRLDFVHAARHTPSASGCSSTDEDDENCRSSSRN